MKVFLIEAILACVVFHVVVVLITTKNPLGSISDYPPKIVERVKELGLIKEVETIKTPKVMLRKGLGGLFFSIVLALVLINFNDAKTFTEGFILSYGLWLVVAWYDAFILDCVWFCHSKKVIIKGTEDMLDEYHNYLFHIKMSCIGSIIGLPVAVIAGILVVILG